MEDYACPGADAILAEHGLKVFKGDGHITVVSSGDIGSGSCAPGLIQVETMLEEDPFGAVYCFATSGARGFLTLEVPNTFLLRGGNKPVEATAQLPGGTEETYDVPANTSVAVEPGDGSGHAGRDPGRAAVRCLVSARNRWAVRVRGDRAGAGRGRGPGRVRGAGHHPDRCGRGRDRASWTSAAAGRLLRGAAQPVVGDHGEVLLHRDPDRRGDQGAPKHATTATIGRVDLTGTAGTGRPGRPGWSPTRTVTWSWPAWPPRSPPSPR